MSLKTYVNYCRNMELLKTLHFFMLQMAPSSLEQLVHFDVNTNSITELYSKGCIWSWKVPTVPSTGFFLFKLWNQMTVSYEYIILRDFHVRQALCIGDVSDLFSVSQRMLVKSISEYVKYSMTSHPYSIFKVCVNNIDEYMRFYPFFRSLYILENATLHLIDLMYTWLSSESHTQRSIEVYDYNYTSYKRDYNDYLFSS